MRSLWPIVAISLTSWSLAACGSSGNGADDAFGSATTMTMTSTTSDTGTTTSGTGGFKFDLGPMDIEGGNPPPSCKVVDDMDAVGECTNESPPDSFNPDIQWTWGGTNNSVTVTPLVINLTDDNNDGEIDLCDLPDVVVVTSGLVGQIHVLDGLTGNEHFVASMGVGPLITPAVGDIDNDGIAEIVSATPGQLSLIAFEHDGTHKWTGNGTWTTDQGGAIAIADLDNDGNPEIMADGLVADQNGNTLWQAPEQVGWTFVQKNTVPTAADLDGDGDLEVILGQAAYHHDGVEYYANTEIKPGYAQIANLDDDDDPEILIDNWDGITILEHDGAVKYMNVRPTNDPVGTGYWFRPATVHDFDGDDESEFAVSSATNYSVFEPYLPVLWSATVQDGSGWAAGTAFDFLGDGTAEAMYADEVSLFVFDGGDGSVLLQSPRSSATLIEYPVVADIDNDGSSEIVVVSSNNFDGEQTSPAVQVIRDAEDRWIQARRIWNQHAYHVTNVREDGTIPQFEPPSWNLLNTFRTNAQIENGSVCKPPPEG